MCVCDRFDVMCFISIMFHFIMSFSFISLQIGAVQAVSREAYFTAIEGPLAISFVRLVNFANHHCNYANRTELDFKLT